MGNAYVSVFDLMSQSPYAEGERLDLKRDVNLGSLSNTNVSLTSVIGVDVLLTVIKTVVTGFAIRTPYGLRTSSMARG